MSIKINHATLARQVNGEVEYIYPKTAAELVEYDSTQNVKEKIDSLDTTIKEINISNIDAKNKVNIPIDEDGNYHNGLPGQVLESNGDGSTVWVSRPKIYVGNGPKPEGYDAQIDPNATKIEVDETLSIKGAAADALATGEAIGKVKDKITSDIEAHNTDSTSHTDIRALITDAKDYILFRDIVTGDVYKVYVENGKLICESTVAKCTGITITTMPNKTSYSIGDVFDPEGMVISATYDDNTSKVTTDYTYSMTTLTGGVSSVTITYIEDGSTFTTTVPITVIVKCIGIDITTMPTKTSYNIGDVFDPTGMVVTASYNDDSTKIITKYTYPTGALVAGASSITIAYNESGSIFTTTVPITVTAKCTGITITTMPNKTSYTSDEVFDPTGMIVTASYNDDSTKAITKYTYPTGALVAGTSSITIAYNESGSIFTTTVPITVVAAFDAASILQDLTYVDNNDGTYTITGWKGTLNGVPSTEVVVPDYSAIIVNPL